MLHYFLLILLNLLNNVILYQLWWDAKCLYEVQIPKCDWCSIGSQCTNIYGDLWREWEGVLFLGSNSGEDLHESIYRSYTLWPSDPDAKYEAWEESKVLKLFHFAFPLPLLFCISFAGHINYSNISRLHFSGNRLQNSPYFCVFKYARAVKQKVLRKKTTVLQSTVGNVLGKAFRILG